MSCQVKPGNSIARSHSKDNERNLSFVIPGRPKGEPGIHLSKMRGGNSWIQIIPLRITFLD